MSIAAQPADVLRPRRKGGVDRNQSGQPRRSRGAEPDRSEPGAHNTADVEPCDAWRPVRFEQRLNRFERPTPYELHPDGPPPGGVFGRNRADMTFGIVLPHCNSCRLEKSREMQRATAREQSRRAQRQQWLMCLEPAIVRDAIIQERKQEWMTYFREQVAQRGTRLRRVPIGGVFDRQPRQFARRQVDRTNRIDEESIREEPHVPRPQCKKIAARLWPKLIVFPRFALGKGAETSYTISGGCCDFSLLANRTGAPSS
jgi:hypothetical protein